MSNTEIKDIRPGTLLKLSTRKTPVLVSSANTEFAHNGIVEFTCTNENGTGCVSLVSTDGDFLHYSNTSRAPRAVSVEVLS